jgi:TP901 family phage tail tape measure protein
MADDIEGEIRLDANDAVQAINKIADSLSKLGGEAQKQFGEFGGQADRAGKALQEAAIEQRLESLSGKLSDFGKAGLKALGDFIAPSIEFSGQLANVNTIARLSGAELEKFNETLRTSSERVGFGVAPAAAAAGAYDILSSGFTKAADATRVLDSSLKLSRAGVATSAQSSDLLTTVLNSYNLTADQSALVTDKLLKTVELGKTTVPELAQSFGLVASIAAQSGVSLDDLSASIAAATAGGVKTSSAMEGARSAISNLVKPSDEAQKTFEKLGIRVDGATLKSEGFLKTIDKIAKAAKGNSTDIATIFADASGRAFVQSLADSGGLNKRTRDAQKGIGNAAGSTDAFLAEQAKSSKAAIDDLNASLEQLKVGAGNTVAPILTGLAKETKSVIDSFDKLSPATKQAGILLTGAGFAASVALGGFISLRLALPLLQGQLVALQLELTGVGVASLRAVAGLVGIEGAATASAAALLTTEVTVAGLATTIGTSVSAAALSIGTATATAFTSLATFTIGLGGLTLGASLAVVGLAAFAVAMSFQIVENAKLATAYESAGASLKEFGKTAAAVSLGDLLLKDSQKLAEAGVNLEAFALKANTLRDNIEKRKNAIKDTKDSFFGGDTTADELALKKDEQNLKKLLDKREEFTKQAKPTTSSEAAAASFAPVVSEKELEKQRESRLKDSIQEVELSKKTAKEKAEAFRQILVAQAKEPDERRQLQRKIADEEEKALKQRQALEKTARDDRFKSALQEIDLSKSTTQEKIDALKKISDRFKLNADEQRSITRDIANLEKKRDEEALDRANNLQKLREQSSELDGQASRSKLDDLKDQESRGVDTSQQQIDELAKRKADAEKAAQLKLKSELAKEKDPAADKILESNDKKRAGQSEQEFSKEVRDIKRQAARESIQDAEDEAKTVEGLAKRKIDILREELERGKDVQAQLKQAILDRLALQEREIQLKLQAEKLETDNPAKIKRLEIEAEGELLDARRAARKEIDETTKAIEKQKQAAKKDSGSLGGLQSLEDVLGEFKKRNVDDVTARIAQIKAENSKPQTTPLDGQIANAQQRIRNGGVAPSLQDKANLAAANIPVGRIGFDLPSDLAARAASVTTGAARAAEPLQRQQVEVNVKADLRLVDSSGKAIPYKLENQRVTIGGRNSEIQVQAQFMSPSAGGVV